MKIPLETVASGLLFGADGGFWFTDFDRPTGDGHVFGRLFHAHADGSGIRCARRGLLSPNGIASHKTHAPLLDRHPHRAAVVLLDPCVRRPGGLPLAFEA